ncbi:MAG: glycosyltransferase [Propionibacteriaceae bacterium]|nr:glycosyltransferase [Propionibacteriaceae bacterium]
MGKPLTVLLVNVLADTRSTGRICKDLYWAYEAAGYEPTIAYGRGTAAPDLRSFKIGSTFDMLEHAGETLLFDNHGMSSRARTRRFLSQVADLSPDVIHLHNIHGYYLNVPHLFAYLKEEFHGHVLWTLHDMWAITGHSAHLTEEERYRDAIPQSGARHWEYPFSAVDRYTRNAVLKRTWFSSVPRMTIVTPSHWLSSVIEGSFLSSYPIHTVHNGTDLETFHPLPPIDHPEKIVLAVASVWSAQKGLPDLIDLAGRLPDGYRLRLIGRLPRSTRLPTSIEHIPRTDDVAHLVQAYSDAHVLVNPTHHETLSMVNIEAQACGTPVITYPTDGAPETIIDGVTGRVTSGPHVDEMLDLVVRSEKNPAISAACVDNAQHFSRERMGEGYLALFPAS